MKTIIRLNSLSILLAGLMACFFQHQASGQNVPPLSSGFSLSYDLERSQVVLFGTGLSGYYATNDTWIWNGVIWSLKDLTNRPPVLHYARTAYDATRREVVLFGGAGDHFRNTNTWIWNGTNWFIRPTATYPTGVADHAMVYDAARQEVLIFGGDNSSGVRLNETWTWNGSDWAKRTPVNSPSPRVGAGVAYDAARQEVVLYGGHNNPNGAPDNSETWIWNGTNWFLRTPGSSPPALTSAAMAFDPARNEVILFGGFGPSSNQTWAWNGTNWTQIVTPTVPPARYGGMLVSDDAGLQSVLFGGLAQPGVGLNDMWFFKNTNWFQATLLTSPPQSQTVIQGSTASFNVTATGSAPLSYQWRKEGNNIAGATGTNYSITSVQATNAGSYSVVVSNAVGVVTSPNATLTVTFPTATFTSSITINEGDTTYDGQNIIVSNAIATINGPHSFNSILLTNNAILTHSPNTSTVTHKLDLQVGGTIVVSSNSVIEVNGLGYLAGRTSGNTTVGGSTVYSGGSFGGLGGNSSGTANGVYGDFMDPNDWGSGGGSVGSGGPGGGLVRLVAGTLVLDGQLRANGPSPLNGAGSGGGIYVAVTNLTGGGSIQARGGNSISGGGGGGGRIAIYATDYSGFTLTNITATGGTGSPAAGAGTVYITNGNPAQRIAPPSGLVSWWPGDGTNDIVGANNLTYSNSVPSVPGKVGSAFSFAGSTSGIGPLANVATPAGLPLGNSPRTIELWAYARSGPPFNAYGDPLWDSGFVQYGSAENGKFFSLRMNRYFPRKLYFTGYNNDLVGTNTLNYDTWYHLAVTYAGSRVALYVNGQLDASTNGVLLNTASSGLSPLGAAEAASPLVIGYERGAGTFWRGLLDEIGIYNRALSSNEIAAVYAAGSAGKSLQADLALSQGVSANPVTVGNNVTFTVAVTNSGPVAADGVVVTTTLPGNVTFVSASPSQGTFSRSGQIISWSAGTLANKVSATIVITVTPLLSGPLVNTAVVSSTALDPNLGNNSSSVQITALGFAGAASWRFETISGLAPGVSLGRVWARTRTEAYVWGSRIVPGTASVPEAFLFRWNGTQWTQVLDLPGQQPGQVFGVGSSEVFISLRDPGLNHSRVFRSVDQGQNFTEQTLPAAGINNELRNFAGTPNNVQIGTVGGNIIRFDGTSWTTVYSNPTEDVYALMMLSANDGYFVTCWGWGRWDGSQWQFHGRQFDFCDLADTWAVRNGGTVNWYAVGNNNFANGVRIWKFDEASQSFVGKFNYVAYDGDGYNIGGANAIWGSASDDIYSNTLPR